MINGCKDINSIHYLIPIPRTSLLSRDVLDPYIIIKWYFYSRRWRSLSEKRHNILDTAAMSHVDMEVVVAWGWLSVRNVSIWSYQLCTPAVSQAAAAGTALMKMPSNSWSSTSMTSVVPQVLPVLQASVQDQKVGYCRGIISSRIYSSYSFGPRYMKNRPLIYLNFLILNSAFFPFEIHIRGRHFQILIWYLYIKVGSQC